ncbi:hypothetical protein [Pseudomonas farsensis]|uniref:DUF4189 domain-containing protein n=1 Tax=Pseudomonas farsensis TaxID=2745492 RepID=A0ABU8QQ64_9PSED
MRTNIARSYLLPLTLLALGLILTGCSGKSARYSAQGSNCYAKALPSSGEGGLAFGPTLAAASRKSMDSCMRYAGRSGGSPKTCQVVVAKCKS